MLHRFVERWQPRPAPDAPRPSDPVRDGLEFAWRIHDTVSEQSGRLDVKASVVLTVETAGAAAIAVAVTNKGNALVDIQGSVLPLFVAALGLLLVAIVLAALVVSPKISPQLHWPWREARRWRDNVIYYGGLRQWEPEELGDHLVSLGAGGQLEVLSRQLVDYSRVAWRKRTQVEYSVALALLAAVLLVVVFFWS